jgi:ferrous iron transport protein B
MATIALVGNPNCGKTTLYNALTGSRQHVGNWPGVTVERKSGFFVHQDILFEVVDLPGVYSLNVATESAIDENIACQFILNHQADFIINILDGSNLERHLYLTLQLIEMKVPLIVAVNMVDIAQAKGISLQLDRLAKLLGCPVVVIQANKGKGLAELKTAILKWVANAEHREEQLSAIVVPYAEPLPALIRELSLQIHSKDSIDPSWLAMRLLEDDVYAREQASPEIMTQVAKCQQKIRAAKEEDADILLADGRYRYIHEVVTKCVAWSSLKKSNWTSRIDNVVLNRVFGIPIFLAVMYALFFFAINVGGALQDFFDMASATIFVDGLGYWLQQQGLPGPLVVFLAQGIGKGINTTISFIPVIGALFLFLAFLEDSGYMARAAFVVDRLMQAFGLPGKAFVPMIVGFGCNVPAVMAARTLENKRDRILTIMMSPFMSCGARLAIYAVFTAAFFPINGHNVVFALYLIGILMAIMTGFVLRKTLLSGQSAPLVMELPPYHVPQFRALLSHAGMRLKAFIFRAGKVIIPICVLMSVLHAFSWNGAINQGGNFNSILASIGHFVTPIFSPMGMQKENWPAAVGLMGGVLAKEVVIGTLNTLYSQLGHISVAANNFHFWQGLYQAVLSIPTNLAQLGQALVHPLFAKVPVHTLNPQVYGVMYQYFNGQVGAFSYLLFVLLYFPCISTTAAMLRELDYRWAIFSILWMTGVAYGTAVVFYQAATLPAHLKTSLLWIGAILALFTLGIIIIRMLSASDRLKVSRHFPAQLEIRT